MAHTHYDETSLFLKTVWQVAHKDGANTCDQEASQCRTLQPPLFLSMSLWRGAYAAASKTTAAWAVARTEPQLHDENSLSMSGIRSPNAIQWNAPSRVPDKNNGQPLVPFPLTKCL